MRKIIFLFVFAVFMGLAGPALGAPPQPTGLTGYCGEWHVIWWNGGAGATHTVSRQIRAHPDQPFSPAVVVAGGLTTNSFFIEAPQAEATRYTVTSLDETGWSPPSAPFTCDSDIRWIAGAETNPTYGFTGEWADNSLVNGATSIVPDPALKGGFSYQCTITQENSSEERCENSQGNASSSDIAANRLYNSGAELWIAYGVYIPSNYAFCTTVCSKDYDGGAITQEKQLGSCGNPVLSMAAQNLPADGSRTITQNNSFENNCPSGSSPQSGLQLWKVPIQPNRWIKILRRIKFSTNPAVGYIEGFADTDGDAANNFFPITTAFFTSDGLAKTHAASSTELGVTERLYTHTQKTGAGTVNGKCDDSPPTGNWPCTHQRAGIYRNPLITGGSTLWHDGIAAGPTAAGVISAAF